MFRSRRSRTRNRGPGFDNPVPRPDVQRGGYRASPVPGGSWCASAVFSDPGRTGHPWPGRCAGAAPVVSKTKAPAGSILEAQWHGLGTGCLRFARAITGQDTRLASGCWLGFTGWDWSPTESLRKVSKVYSLHLFLLSQASLGARTVYATVRPRFHGKVGERRTRLHEPASLVSGITGSPYW